MSKKVILIVMDGWGHGPEPSKSAIACARTPFIDSLYQNYPNAELVTHSEYVGLPDGQMGNSEVGHLNIGAGRVVYQELVRINKSIRDGELAANPVLQNTFSYCLENNKPLHLMGLVSDGGVHSHISHLKALCNLAIEAGIATDNLIVHAFTDGRDCDPKSGAGFVADLETHLSEHGGRLASVCGRYYAMDRDNRWERVQLAYNMLTKGEGASSNNFIASIEDNYDNGVTDEFLQPIVSAHNFKAISNGDAVLCFNFRTDRCREITKVLTQQDMPEYNMQRLQLHYVTATNYDHRFVGVEHLFANEDLKLTLGEVLSNAGKTQVRAAETEKYPHVTFFFSGGREKEFDGETRILVPSPKVATYDLQPEMSAPQLCQRILEEIEKHSPDFMCINFANTDMVGHTGVFSAAVKAAETVSECVGKIAELALQIDYALIITADHGNADYMVNEDGTPNTAHTLNPVPVFLVDNTLKAPLHNGKLADIAPTVLKLMGIPQPAEMGGESLF